MRPTPDRKSIRPSHALLALAGGLWLLCSLTTACAGFRGMVMDMKNDDLLGKASPGIQDGTWVRGEAEGAYGTEDTGHTEDEDNTADERWRLLVFFLPT